MHSREATINLLKIFDEGGTDVVCIQEPYVIHKKLLVSQKHRIYAIGEGRHRAAIVVTNNQIDTCY